jgi:glycosyltransferase involved in cell wall biosynthesis
MKTANLICSQSLSPFNSCILMNKNSTSPLISIITITFNAGHSLESTIQSVINQKYNNLEYIIIDGGSTDNTVSIIKKYSSNITYWISEPDRGISDAWNKGITASCGDLIGILNAGDYFEDENYLKHIAKDLPVEEKIIGYGNTQIVKNNGEVVRSTIGNFKPQKLHLGLGFYHPGCFATRKTYDEIGNFNLRYKLAMDCDWLLRCYRAGVKFKKTNLVCMMLDGGVSHTSNFSAYGEYLQALNNNGFSSRNIYSSMVKVGLRGLVKSLFSKAPKT